MTIMALNGKETDDRDQAWGAYANATISSLEAKQAFPAFEQYQHLSDVQDVEAEVAGFTGFQNQNTNRSTNLYQNQRIKVGGEINGPATALKYMFNGQRNFTKKDCGALEAHLKLILPNLKFNVCFHGSKPHCVVHIGL